MIYTTKQSDLAPFRHSTNSKSKVAANKKASSKPPVMIILAACEDDLEGRNNYHYLGELVANGLQRRSKTLKRRFHTRVLSRPRADVEMRQILPLPFSGEQIKVQKHFRRSTVRKSIWFQTMFSDQRVKRACVELLKCIKTYQIYHALKYLICHMHVKGKGHLPSCSNLLLMAHSYISQGWAHLSI